MLERGLVAETSSSISETFCSMCLREPQVLDYWGLQEIESDSTGPVDLALDTRSGSAELHMQEMPTVQSIMDPTGVEKRTKSPKL